MTALAEHYTMRPTTMDDLDTAVALFNTCSIEEIGRPFVERYYIENEWTSPDLNLETDTRVVIAPDGALVGYIEVWDRAPHVHPWVWARVHPDHRGRGIGTTLEQWAEQRARQAIPKAPEGARVSMLQGTLSTHQPAQALLQQQGYQAIRHALRMVIEMDEPPPEPVLPEGITIRPFVRGREERAVVDTTRKAFRDHWGHVERSFEEEYTHWMHMIENDPDHDPALWFVAMEGEDMVGVSLCRPKVVEDADMGFVDTLGVRRPWRRRGIALALLQHSFGELYRRGKRRVGLGVDAQSLTGATRLYEKAGMHVQRRHITWEKELRPGEELAREHLEG